MKVILNDQYKSLSSFESEALNQLTVITGKNGSGKSQLLDLINKKSKNNNSVSGVDLKIEPEMHLVQAEGIIKNNVSQVTHDQWKQVVNKNLQAYKSLKENTILYLKTLSENNIMAAGFKMNETTPLVNNTPEFKTLISKSWAEVTGQPLMQEAQVSSVHQRNLNRKVLNHQNEGMIKFIEELCQHTGKSEGNLVEADFYNSPIQEHLIDENDLFSSQVEIIFYNYAKRRDQNRKAYFYKKEEGENNASTSDSEFVKLYQPPWNVINQILDALEIDFYFKGIEKSEFTIEAPIEFSLLKKSSEEKIPFNDLSSGEKVIIGLIIKLFTSEYYQEKLSFPELLILDEPDSHLHPEMSKLLLDVLEETFVKRYGIKVIITTHSPSTIALCKEEYIYQLQNGEITSLKKISKDDALKLLTSFIPTLSIDYNNHKQVFVESPTDRYYYESIFNRLNLEYRYPFKLYFISNGYGKGNCEQVVDVVKEIRKSGNDTCFGIIDWDKKNKSDDFIKVHGQNNRYSLENFTYDPIYLAVLFLEMKALNLHTEIGIDLSFNEYTIGENPALIKLVIDWFFKSYYLVHNVSQSDKENLKTVYYHNEVQVDIPMWYLEFNGHDLEQRLKQAFKPLEKFRSEGKLQQDLSIIAAKCFPLVPKDTEQIITNIING